MGGHGRRNAGGAAGGTARSFSAAASMSRASRPRVFRCCWTLLLTTPCFGMVYINDESPSRAGSRLAIHDTRLTLPGFIDIGNAMSNLNVSNRRLRLTKA